MRSAAEQRGSINERGREFPPGASWRPPRPAFRSARPEMISGLKSDKMSDLKSVILTDFKFNKMLKMKRPGATAGPFKLPIISNLRRAERDNLRDMRARYHGLEPSEIRA